MSAFEFGGGDIGSCVPLLNLSLVSHLSCSLPRRRRPRAQGELIKSAVPGLVPCLLLELERLGSEAQAPRSD